MTEKKEKVINLIKASIHPERKYSGLELDETVMDELARQALVPLPATVFDDVEVSGEVTKRWKPFIFGQVQRYYNNLIEQERIGSMLEEIGARPVVLKGMSAALYYDKPEYRTVGDMDIILSPNSTENVEKARKILQENGYAEVDDNDCRVITFYRNNMCVELHRYFSLKMTDGEEILDDIIEQSEPVERTLSDKKFYSFDDITNGLILLQHINQHLYDVLGLRQIIDWLLWASKCLYGDEAASDQYLELAEQIGLRELAIHMQRLGELYFDMEEQPWSASTDDKTAAALFDMVYSFGNFGRGMDNAKAGAVSVMKDGFPSPAELQRRGLYNWKAAQKHPVLKPLAWAYQLGRYFNRGVLKRTPESGSVLDNYREVKAREDCLKKLKAGEYRK